MNEKLEREIRSVQRQHRALKTPIEPSERLDVDREPIGLRLGGLKTFAFPHEGILDAVLNFAQSVWHFKDYLKVAAPTKRKDVESFADGSVELKICADLANMKKHARLDRPRSALAPDLGIYAKESATVGVVQFDTSRCGMFEFAYNGKTKQHQFWVTHPGPIPFRVDVLVSTSQGLESKGDAVDFIYAAFGQWQHVMQQLGIQIDKDFTL